MKNLIILGSGRSGTSAVAGLFRHVPGIFYGYDPLQPSQGNPTGYYEDEVVNTINNILLRQMTGVTLLDLVPSWLRPFVARHIPWTHRDTRSLWLACPKRPLRWEMSYDVAHLVGRMARNQPFCFKDPRFGFTLPLWRPYLPDDARFIVVFRDPVQTIRSILRDAVELYGERPLAVTEDWAINHWKLIHNRIFEQRAADKDGQWLFLELGSVLSGRATAALERFCDHKIDTVHLRPLRAYPSPQTKNELGIKEECGPLFERLCAMAETDLNGWTPGGEFAGPSTSRSAIDARDLRRGRSAAA